MTCTIWNFRIPSWGKTCVLLLVRTLCLKKKLFLPLMGWFLTLLAEKFSRGKQFRERLNDLGSLVLTCGSKNQLVNSVGVPGLLVGVFWNQQPFIGHSSGNNLHSTAFCIWRLVYVTGITLLGLWMLHLPSTEIVPTRAEMEHVCLGTEFPGSHHCAALERINYVFLPVSPLCSLLSSFSLKGGCRLRFSPWFKFLNFIGNFWMQEEGKEWENDYLPLRAWRWKSSVLISHL